MWQELLNFLGAERYSQHSICLTNDSLMIFLYVLSDLIIFSSYFMIGIALMMTGRLPCTTLPHRRTIFGMFIFLCGLTHLTDVFVLFSGVYRLDGNLQYTTAGGLTREGVASSYIRRLTPGDRVTVAVKAAHRQLPESFDGPLLLIGAGTGLSQLFAVLEDRAARNVLSRPDRTVKLYFGCRNEAEFLMRDRLLAWRAVGVIDSVTVALSRQTPTKAYVQDALNADADAVLELLRQPDAHVMVCGDARMSFEVADTIRQILQREGRLSYVEATERLRDLRDGGRYMEDVWGVQLNRDLALAEVIREKYDQGASWLSRLTRKLNPTRATPQAIRRY